MKLTGRSGRTYRASKRIFETKPYVLLIVEKEDPNYTDVIELDLSTVEASLSGPKRPQDLIFLSDMKSSFENL